MLLFFPLFVHFLSFKAKFVSRFSQDLFKVKSSIMEFICKMSDRTVGLRLELITLFLLFFIHFLSLQFRMLTLKICAMLTLKICARVFLGSTEIRMDDELWYGVIRDPGSLLFPLFIHFSVFSG